MITLQLRPGDTVIALGAHSDDIEIGAAGTLLVLADRFPDVEFTFVIAAADPERGEEARLSARELLGRKVQLQIGDFKDGYLPYRDPADVKKWLADVIPDGPSSALIFAPWQDDQHQDHRFMGRLAWQLFRQAPVLEYQVPKWESEQFAPNVLVPLTETQASRKLDHLGAHFISQQDKPWYDRELLAGLMRARGVEHGSATYAEGFVMRKASLRF